MAAIARLIGTFAMFVMLSSCNDDADTVATLPPPGDAPEDVARTMDDLSRENRGRAVLAYARRADGTEWAHAAGFRNGVEGDVAEWSDRLEIGGATMMFTAAAVIRLHEDGKLDIDEPLTTYFDRALLDDLTKGNGALLRVRHLLNHTTGIGDHIDVAARKESVIAYYTGTENAAYSPFQLVEQTRQFTIRPKDYPTFDRLAFPAFTPQSLGVESYDDVTVNAYSNTGYVMLGIIVERASGMAYEDFVQAEIIAPLGLTDTGFSTRGQKASWRGWATGVADGPVSTPPTLTWSAGAIVSTARDMGTFLRAAFKESLFRSPTTSEVWRAEGYNPPLRGLLPYGYGIMRPYASALGHEGQTFGARFIVAYDVEADIVTLAAVGDSQVGDMVRLVRTIARAAGADE